MIPRSAGPARLGGMSGANPAARAPGRAPAAASGTPAPAAEGDGGRVRLRLARPTDNAALIALAAACPMEGDIGLCVDRAPDFFALNRLEGERWEVAVAEVGGEVAGCIAVSERHAYLRGDPAWTLYVGDLKVHPRRRGGAAADLLEHHAIARAASIDPDRPMLLTILAGNQAMERRMPGPRGLPVLERFATVRSHAIPLLHPRSRPDGWRIEAAEERDVEEMADLWARVAPGRQLAPVLDADGFADWVRRAPGLELDDYRIARGRDGRVAGFAAFWDQSPLKAMRVTHYSRRLRLARGVLDLAARAIGAARMPAPGEALRCRTAVHVCVPEHRPDVLRALVLDAYQRFRGDHALLLVGLDTRDPLAPAVTGLLAQPTDVHACVTGGHGRYRGPRLDERPLHYEIALV